MTGCAENPFVGPRPFEIGERLWGRDREIRALDDLLSARRIVLLCSPSGAGKSSLVQAGLVPRLKGSFDVWGPTRVRQEANVEGANRYALSAVRGFEEGIPDTLRRPPRVLAAQTLVEYVGARPRRRSAPPNLLLIFDQFEEILTVDPPAVEARREFFDQLGALLRLPRVWALLVLREEFLVALDPYAEQVPTHLRNRLRLDLLGLDQAREAMVNPARAAGREFVAAEELIHDLATMKVQQPDGSFVERTGRHVEPVQLQVVCRRLWDAMPAAARSIESSDLERFGNVDQALAGYYADAVGRIGGGVAARVRAIRDWLGEKLITADGIRGQVRRGVGDSEGLANELVDALLDTHLVRAEKRAGATWYELAHDRLIEPVRESNAAWRAEHLSEVQQRAQLWERQGRPPGLLLTDASLAAAERWAAEAAVVTADERRFLEESRRAHAVAERERRQARFIRRLAVVSSVVGALALVAGLVAGVQWRRSEAQTRKARDLARASVAASLLAEGRTLEANLALLEVREPAATPTAVATLHRALAVPVEAVVLAGHTDMVGAAAWNPDGRRLATASHDGSARIWDAEDGEPLLVLAGHSAPVLTAAWNRDGTRLATASEDGTARIWNVEDGGAERVLAAHAGTVTAVAWSADGTRLVTASEDGTARIWDAEDGAVLAVLEGHADAVLDVAWSADHRRLATASRDGTARIWDAEDGTETAVLAGHAGQVHAVAWSGDGRRLATASFDGTARIWDAEDGVVLAELRGHRGALGGVAWSGDGRRLLSASIDHTARIWSLEGEAVALLQGHRDWISASAWSADDRRLATASYDGTARIWDAVSGKTLGVLRGHADALKAVAWSPDGRRLVTTSLDRTARIWDTAASGEALALLAGHELGLGAAAWSGDGRRVATASRDGTARIWDAEDGALVGILGGHTAPVAAVAWSAGGRRLATASSDRTARIWDADAGSVTAVLEGHRDWVSAVAWSPDARRVATASKDRTARVWDAATGQVLAVLEGHKDWVATVAWSPDGRLLTASADGTARVWNPASGAGEAVLAGHVEAVTAAAWSADGERVLTASRDRTARIWDAATGETLAVLEGHAAAVLEAAWSAGGGLVVTASGDGTARIWDVATGEPVRVLRGHGDAVRAASFRGDGRRLVTASLDRTARLWDTARGELLVSLEGHADTVSAAAWSPDGTRVLTASYDATARIWASAEDPAVYLQARTRARTRLCLTAAVRRQSLGETAAEARDRAAACESCVAVFFNVLAGAPVADYPAAVKAWEGYRRCFLAHP